MIEFAGVSVTSFVKSDCAAVAAHEAKAEVYIFALADGEWTLTDAVPMESSEAAVAVIATLRRYRK